MRIHIMAGGPPELHPELELYQGEDVVWAAVDRGVYHLLQQGIIPAAAFGDFDSVTDVELAWIHSKQGSLQIMPREKDETDLEIALNWALAQQPDCIYLFGATGGRLDHALVNVQLLVKGLAPHIPIVIVDSQNKLSLCQAGRHTLQRDAAFPYISFLPFTEAVTGLTLDHFKYPLREATIHWGSTLCISNELLSENGTFSFTSGILMVVRSKD